jgi:putative colanic acid biosynthesis acetyltransferase WcaB
MVLLKKVITAAKQNPNVKGKIVVCSYVFMRYFRVRMNTLVTKILFSPIIIIYKFITDFLLKCEIPASTIIGEGLVLHHATGLVLNNGVVIGKNVTLKHHTTIGNKENLKGVNLGCPTIGDNVSVGPHTIIIGPIVVGNNSIIGAGSVVVKDVPPFAVVAGNPAKVIRFLNEVQVG